MLILAFVVLAATGTGGWLYCSITRDILQQDDHRQADRLASALSLSAAAALQSGDRESLQRLAAELRNHSNVHFVSVLSSEGKVLAIAERVRPGLERYSIADMPASMSYQTDRSGDFLEVGRPIVVSASDLQGSQLAGAVRLVMDTRGTSATLAQLQREITLIAAVTILCGIPLGHLLVWRVILVPIRRLLAATRRLADGDFGARAQTTSRDEIGELGASFDVMAGRLHLSQTQLRQANESLERKVAERTAELAQANRRLCDEMAEKEDFLRAVSHDLNAPLRNIAGMASMVAMRWRSQLPQEVLARLQRIQANVKAETDLINELLELSRIKSRPQKRELLDFGAMLEDLRGAFEYELKQRNIRLDVLGPMPSLYVERNRMRGVFQNLIDNAIKYMGDRTDGIIEVGCRSESDRHCFYVADNGPGIDPADQTRIFQVFRRAASASTAKVEGKGVGLAWVKTVVSNYDGRVWVESAPGEGSTFHVELSRRRTESPSQGTQDASEDQESAGLAVAGSVAG